MKIGILTLPLHTNYGGILQAWALQTVLERLGHEVKVITHPLAGKKTGVKAKLKGIIINTLNKILGRTSYFPFFWWKEKEKETLYIRQNTNRFIDANIHARYVNSLSELQEKDFDCYVVGSDQIWRRIYPFWGSIESAYLDFAESWKVKRIAYAPSFGKDSIDEYSAEEKARCKSLIRKFDKVSVRESSGIGICQKEYGVDAVQLLDPTMLLSKEDYVKLIDAYERMETHQGLFNYVLDDNEDVASIISKASDFLSVETFKVNGKSEDPDAPLEQRVQGPVENWLNAFHTAKAIVTDSFHACVFSIIFNKPFLVYANAHRGSSRFDSLLSQFGLEDRLIASGSDFEAKKHLLSETPNANDKLSEKRATAISYLKEI